MTARILALLLLALISAELKAQDEAEIIPSGERLRGKAGAKIESGFQPELAPRDLDLARLDLPGRVEEAFIERLRERLEEDDYEALRQRRIERMQRKLGTTMAEAGFIREQFEIEDGERKPASGPKPKHEDDSGSVWLFFSAFASLIGYAFWKTRAV